MNSVEGILKGKTAKEGNRNKKLPKKIRKKGGK